MKTLKDLFRGKDKSEMVHAQDNTLITGGQTRYFCPMKCEGDKTYNAPTVCPVCNMNLVPVENSASQDHHKHHHGCC